MKLNSYLTFNGQCEAAFKFYEQCLGGKIVCQWSPTRVRRRRNKCQPEWRNKILHARLIGGRRGVDGFRRSA